MKQALLFLSWNCGVCQVTGVPTLRPGLRAGTANPAHANKLSTRRHLKTRFPTSPGFSSRIGKSEAGGETGWSGIRNWLEREGCTG